MTLITFGFALTAVPISGANAPNGGLPYPYLDTLMQYPKDYRWMFFALALIICYLILMQTLQAVALPEHKLFGQISTKLATISGAILLVDYFLQLAVVPVSLMHNETNGLSLLTQYNPHGIFIALEELGYILMSLSFLAIAPIFYKKNSLDITIKWIFISTSIVNFLAFVAISIFYGLNRLDRFEVISLSICWLAIIVNSMLLLRYFYKRMR